MHEEAHREQRLTREEDWRPFWAPPCKKQQKAVAVLRPVRHRPITALHTLHREQEDRFQQYQDPQWT